MVLVVLMVLVVDWSSQRGSNGIAHNNAVKSGEGILSWQVLPWGSSTRSLSKQISVQPAYTRLAGKGLIAGQDFICTGGKGYFRD